MARITPKEMTDVYAECNSISRQAEAQDARVQWIPETDKNQTPRADLEKRVIFVPTPRAEENTHAKRLRRGATRHEFGHLDPSQRYMLDVMDSEGVDFGSYLGKAVNAVNDDWQERIASSMYLGGAQDLEYMASFFCARGKQDIEAGKLIADSFMGKLLAWHYLCRSKWQEGVQLYVDAWLDAYPIPDEWYALADRCAAISDISDLREASLENINIARALFDSDPEAPEPEQQESEGGAGGKGDDGDGEDWRQYFGDEHGDGEDGIEELSSPAMDCYREEMPKAGIGEYKPVKPEFFHHNKPERDPEGDWLDGIREIRSKTAQVSGAIRRLFQSESQTKSLYQQKRGRITARSLARLPAGETRIFHKKIKELRGEADVSLLVDASGSMCGRRYSYACAAAIAVSEALSAADIPCLVSAFSTSGRYVKHYKIKDWREPAIPEDMEERLGGLILAENADGDNIMQSVRELNQRGNKRKVLIVLSDGEPSHIRAEGNLEEFTRKTIAHAMSKGIEIYGIGIESPHVKEFYPKHRVINNPSDIEKALTSVIKETLLERM